MEAYGLSPHNAPSAKLAARGPEDAARLEPVVDAFCAAADQKFQALWTPVLKMVQRQGTWGQVAIDVDGDLRVYDAVENNVNGKWETIVVSAHTIEGPRTKANKVKAAAEAAKAQAQGEGATVTDINEHRARRAGAALLAGTATAAH